MHVKKSLMVAGTIATLGIAGVTGLGVASAATSSTGSDNLIDKIATKFNLNRSDVEQVFEEQRAADETEHQKKVEARLDALVSEGKLTKDQKAKILTKLTELKAERESEREAFKDKTKEEIRALMQQRHDDLKKWAQDNGIPLEYMPFAMKPHGMGVMHQKHMLPDMPDMPNMSVNEQ